jgi:antitoxin (DNA-binding transcriptional repressor) of toxin-antitoxin stability system
MVSMTVSDARACLPALLTRVEAGEEVTLTRHGKAVAVLVRPDALRHRRADAAFAKAQEVHDLLAEARTRPISSGGLTVEYGEALIGEIRAGRDAR